MANLASILSTFHRGATVRCGGPGADSGLIVGTGLRSQTWGSDFPGDRPGGRENVLDCAVLLDDGRTVNVTHHNLTII